MDLALILSACALGLAGAPHCLAMCAAPCALATGPGRSGTHLAFHLARVVSYAAAGALAAASVNALGVLADLSPIVKPVWALLHAAALALGLWLLIKGRQPRWLESVGRRPGRRQDGPGADWVPIAMPGRAAAIGALWVAWPCGLLQSAIVVAALANGPVGGASVMAAFGMVTALALVAGPWAWRRMASANGAAVGMVQTLGVRVGGGLLAAASGWALGRGIWAQVAAYCAI